MSHCSSGAPAPTSRWTGELRVLLTAALRSHPHPSTRMQVLQPAPCLLLPIVISVSQHPSLAHAHLLPPTRPTLRSSSSSLAHFHAGEALLSKPVWRMFVYASIVIFPCKLGPMHFGIFIFPAPSFSLSPSPSFPPVILCKIVWMMIAGEVMVTMMNQAGGWRARFASVARKAP